MRSLWREILLAAFNELGQQNSQMDHADLRVLPVHALPNMQQAAGAGRGHGCRPALQDLTVELAQDVLGKRWVGQMKKSALAAAARARIRLLQLQARDVRNEQARGLGDLA